MLKTCDNNLIAQKIRSLDAIAKLLKKISKILKNNFIYLNLEKKESKELQTNPDRYIKAISFTILFVRTKFSHLNLE